MTQATAGTQLLSTTTTGHDRWMDTVGIPIHRGYFIDDLRTLELGWWDERECQAAFLEMHGQEGVTEVRVTEIAPGKTLPPVRFSLDETVYVVEGRGLTTVWADGKEKKTFEWQKHSLFLLPGNHTYQLSNTQGDRPVRLMHTNYLPMAMSAIADPRFYFQNSYDPPETVDFYSEAKVITQEGQGARVGSTRSLWSGNFFPDMRVWDQLDPLTSRGAGGRAVMIDFPGSELTCHMSVIPALRYKKAHRHGAGFVIVIPAGEGYSIMWPEGEEKQVVPWHEASIFVPPLKWFHQHFNVGERPARYLAIHPPRGRTGTGETVVDPSRNQIEFDQEDVFVRQKFEEELRQKGFTTRMVEEAYTTPDYQWTYDPGENFAQDPA